MKLIFILQKMPWLYDYKAQFPLGILYVSTVLKKNGWNVGFFDNNISEIDKVPHADVYGFSITCSTYNDSLVSAKELKDKYPNSKIIAGGAHSTLAAEMVSEMFDSIFIGEAENTIIDFIKDFKTKNIKKIYRQVELDDIDNIYPDRELVSDEYIRTDSVFAHKKVYKEGGGTSIMFSRGCPYKCTFCASVSIYNGKVRFRSIESIVKEIKDIIDKYQIYQFRVQDDTFTINKEFFKKLCEALKPLGIFYRCSTRVNHMDDEMARLLYESGCREVGVGVEIANNEALKKLKKQITVEQIEAALTSIRTQPIALRTFFMVGTPFDSVETMKQNEDFLERNKISSATVANFIPLPGTEMYTDMSKFNIKKIKEEVCMNISKNVPFVPNILRTDISEEEHIQIVEPFCQYLSKKGFL